MGKHKKVCITGATSGVGLLLAKKLQADGYEVWATGRNIAALDELNLLGIHTIQADLTVEQSFENLFEEMGTPDVVVHCAGVGTFAYLTDLEETHMDQMLQINVLAPMKLTKYFATKMKKRRNGHIIFVASQAGKVATPKATVYAASKHAIIGFANAVRMELKEFGIKISTINPGPIDTPFLDLADQTGNYRERLSKHLLSPETVVSSIEKVIQNPVREIDLPSYMSITSKLYAVFPKMVETVGKRFFTKK
ncbi:SDR family NAD(P)-dependent oxidoreductase [Psychrobacillus lasiicapitis]|uniref:SDR family NAD(P)-dependent oxidoreductase n=1 Tax=Psychrobacillus lasiicapitis TaxID=1636719 RepID=A0A544SWQ3_9BACI|nr:SDR family NAD(P)-dependent oxidoreductase [Psychrobacillus lasiicapitis]TQR09605.1 SDR family NAD(P)-dependent oxidoreductase [Psychrobacillus lasiicapitis]GGA29076.1 oxidoreductase [Psychrobacillus lasiicapitis]